MTVAVYPGDCESSMYLDLSCSRCFGLFRAGEVERDRPFSIAQISSQAPLDIRVRRQRGRLRVGCTTGLARTGRRELCSSGGRSKPGAAERTPHCCAVGNRSARFIAASSVRVILESRMSLVGACHDGRRWRWVLLAAEATGYERRSTSGRAPDERRSRRRTLARTMCGAIR